MAIPGTSSAEEATTISSQSHEYSRQNNNPNRLHSTPTESLQNLYRIGSVTSLAPVSPCLSPAGRGDARLTAANSAPVVAIAQ